MSISDNFIFIDYENINIQDIINVYWSGITTTLTQQERGSKMVYQVVVEKIMRATATVPEKSVVLVQPESISAYDTNEAILLLGVKYAKVLSEANADYLKVTIRAFI